MRTVAVIGDVGGHRALLVEALVGLGAAERGGEVVLPAGLCVVQVGDLVHRGPDSAGVVRLVDGLLRRQPEQWVQLVGNHEQRYVDREVFVWRERLDGASAELLRCWWRCGWMRPAAAITDRDGVGWLAAHGGLTAEFRRDVLGRPGTAAEAADRINEMAAVGDERLWRPGAKLTGVPDRWAGPVWADAGSELYPSWLDRYAERAEPPPFAQVHGHSQALRFDGDADGPMAGVVKVDEAARHQWCVVGGMPLVGVDPRHGTRGAPHWAPLVLPDATVSR